MPDVVITGVGLLTPMGNSLAEVRDVFSAGRPVIRAFHGPNERLRIGARLDRHDHSTNLTRSQQALLDPVALLAIAAAEAALADSGLKVADADADRIGVFLGTGQGTLHSNYESTTTLAQKDQIASLTLLKGLPNSAAGHISMMLGLRGECSTLSIACSSSNMAIAQAMRAIRHGYLDAAVAGGSEATFVEGGIRAWEALRVLAKIDPAAPETSCRPFSKDRTGLVLGEGAVLYMLEAEHHARARGARIYARLAGAGMSADATHITLPSAEGQAIALRNALKDTGLAPSDIGYINAHGTATMAGDAIETQSIRMAFGDQAEQIPISSTKSIHGHMLGAAGAVELLASLLALTDGLIAPTANLHVPDADCDLDYVPNHARHGVSMHATMSSSFAFGGSNACLVLTRA